jgi:hypothetical protein
MMKRQALYFLLFLILSSELVYLSIQNRSLARTNSYYNELFNKTSIPTQDYFANINIQSADNQRTERLLRYDDRRDILLLVNLAPAEMAKMFSTEKEWLNRLSLFHRILALYEYPRYEAYFRIVRSTNPSDSLGCYKFMSSELISVPKTGVYLLSPEGKLLTYSETAKLEWLLSLGDSSGKSP